MREVSDRPRPGRLPLPPLVLVATVAVCACAGTSSREAAWPAQPSPEYPRHQSPPEPPVAPATMEASEPSQPSWMERYRGAKPLSVQRGKATHYADSLAGRPTASGAPYDPALFTAAHKTLPFGSVVRVVAEGTGALTYAKINDRGPFGSPNKIIDLSRAAAEELGLLGAGVLPVRVELLETPEASSGR